MKVWPVIFLLMLGAASSAHAQTSADFFAPGIVHDVQLFMNSRDVQRLRERYDENTYYQADFEWRGIRARSVAIRSRGFGSRNGTKPSLKVDFDRFATGQRFLGLESVVLDNFWQDDSLVRETVTMALFARMEQPAPREAYARLFINGEYQGLYALVEAIDSAFLARAFADETGYAFEYQWQGEFHGEYLGRSLDRYRDLFSPENHQLESDAALYLPLHDLFREVNATSSPTWRESVGRYLDVQGFLTQVAIEQFLSELDGILGAWAMNNFYLYRPSGSTRHVFIPWDRDNAFQAADAPVMQRADKNVLVRRLLEFPDLHAFFLRALETVARLAQSGWLEGEIVAKANLIRDAAFADPRKRPSNEGVEATISGLRTFARTRPAFVLTEISRLRAQSALSYNSVR